MKSALRLLLTIIAVNMALAQVTNLWQQTLPFSGECAGLGVIDNQRLLAVGSGTGWDTGSVAWLALISLSDGTVEYDSLFRATAVDTGSGFKNLCTSWSISYAVGYAVSESSQGWLCKFDAAGAPLWSRQLALGNQTVFYDCLQFFSFGPDSSGRLYEDGCLVSALSDGQLALVRYSWNGDTLWSRHYGPTPNLANCQLARGADGGFALSGGCLNGQNIVLLVADSAGNNPQIQIYDLPGGRVTGIRNYGDEFFLSGLAGNDCWIGLTDSTGQIAWDSSYSLGTSWGALNAGDWYLLAGSSGSSGWLAQVSGQGEIAWQDELDGAGADRLNVLDWASDGTLMLGGQSGQNPWLARVITPLTTPGALTVVFPSPEDGILHWQGSMPWYNVFAGSDTVSAQLLGSVRGHDYWVKPDSNEFYFIRGSNVPYNFDQASE